MTFCTKCGHKNQAGDRFCDACGNPLAQSAIDPAGGNVSPSSTNTQTSFVAIPAPRGPSKKLALYLGAGLGVLIAIGVGLFFLFASETPSNEVFAKAIDRALINDPPSDLKQLYCLQNFAYDKDPVTVNSYDAGTQRWLSVLTKAGLYSEPETVTQTNGFFQSTALRYQKTEAGKKSTQDGRLCIADGLMVASVESFSPPEQVGHLFVSRADVKLVLKKPMPWVSAEETRVILPSLGQETSRSFLLTLTDKKWDVANETTARRVATDQRRHAAGTPSPTLFSLGGFFDTLKNMFSVSGANPLIGRWKSDVMGISVARFEFDSDTMTSNGQKVAVRYEIGDKRVTVYADGEAVGTVFNVIDKDTLSIDTGFIEMKIKRVP